MTWAQAYDPLGNLFASALVAALPVVVLLGLLGLLQTRAYVAALCGLGSALVIAVAVFRMPVVLAAASAGYGIAFGLFPIGWIVLNAIFIYDVTVKTGKFEVVKHGIAALASDRRIQALLIAFSFGAFIEGAAGFGTPVAISAALLVGLGFKPLQAAGLSLLGNTAARRLWRPRHAADRLGQGHGAGPRPAQRNGWAAASVLLAFDSLLAGRRHVRMEGTARGLAGLPRRRREFCHIAVPRQQLSRPLARRRHQLGRVDAGLDCAAALLAASHGVAI